MNGVPTEEPCVKVCLVMKEASGWVTIKSTFSSLLLSEIWTKDRDKWLLIWINWYKFKRFDGNFDGENRSCSYRETWVEITRGINIITILWISHCHNSDVGKRKKFQWSTLVRKQDFEMKPGRKNWTLHFWRKMICNFKEIQYKMRLAGTSSVCFTWGYVLRMCFVFFFSGETRKAMQILTESSKNNFIFLRLQ